MMKISTSLLSLKRFSLVLFLLLFKLSMPVFAGEEVNANGVMLHGYDPITYHQEQVPRKGKNNIQATYQEGIYNFVSEANRDLFLSNVERFAPVYGGFCSYGVRVGKKFDVDPFAWMIVDERLFLQLDPGTHLVWKNDMAANIKIADKIWPKIQSKTAASLN